MLKPLTAKYTAHEYGIMQEHSWEALGTALSAELLKDKLRCLACSTFSDRSTAVYLVFPVSSQQTMAGWVSTPAVGGGQS